MKMYYWYNGVKYYYSQIQDLEKIHGWDISMLYPSFNTPEKISITNGVPAICREYGVRSYHLEFFPTCNKEFLLVSDDRNNPGSLRLSFK